jgi:hypothetical protein
MTNLEYKQLEPGDIVSHVIRPWTTFIITYKEISEDFITYFACKQGVGSEVITITSGTDWFLISKVVQRKH